MATDAETTVDLASDTPHKDLQSIVGCKRKVEPEAALDALTQRKKTSKTVYWPHLEPVLVDDSNRPPSCKVAKLKCTQCNAHLAAGNPANVGICWSVPNSGVECTGC
jgi:hypothetical protein